MSIRDTSKLPPDMKARNRRMRKEDQEWELAGLARRDGDLIAAARHTANALALRRGERIDQ